MNLPGRFGSGRAEDTRGPYSLMVLRARRRESALVADELVVLHRDDLPVAIPPQPSVRPNQASRFGRSVFPFSERTLTAVDYREVVTEKTDLSIEQSAILSGLGDVRDVRYFFRFRVAFPFRGRSLKVVGEYLFRNLVVVARSLGPSSLGVNHELGGCVVGRSPLSLLATRSENCSDCENN
jgi:hypothetical protein